MTILKILILTLIALYLTGCNETSSSASSYHKLKQETGATNAELEKVINFYAELYEAMEDEIESGRLTAEDLVSSVKQSSEIMAIIQREDELLAIMTLKYLKAFEEVGADQARELMSKQLIKFTQAEFPSTENSELIRQKIFEYAKKSTSLAPINQ